MSTLDRSALRQGAIVALVIGVPFAVGSSLVNDDDTGSPLVAVLWLGALGGFTLGAGIAAWVQTRGLPLFHGIVCAGGTYLAAQGLFSVVRLVRGESVSWVAIFFTFSIVLSAGLIGGGLGSLLRKKGFVPRGREQT